MTDNKFEEISRNEIGFTLNLMINFLELSLISVNIYICYVPLMLSFINGHCTFRYAVSKIRHFIIHNSQGKKYSHYSLLAVA